jgi:hypothetical protein
MRDEEGAILVEIEELLLLLKRRWFVVWLTYKLVAWHLDGGARGGMYGGREIKSRNRMSTLTKSSRAPQVFDSFNIMPSCTCFGSLTPP